MRDEYDAGTGRRALLFLTDTEMLQQPPGYYKEINMDHHCKGESGTDGTELECPVPPLVPPYAVPFSDIGSIQPLDFSGTSLEDWGHGAWK